MAITIRIKPNLNKNLTICQISWKINNPRKNSNKEGTNFQTKAITIKKSNIDM